MKKKYSHPHHHLPQIRIARQPQFFAQPVSAAFDAAHGNIEEVGDFLGAEVHAQVGAEAVIVGGELRVMFAQAFEKVAVYRVEVDGEMFPVGVELGIELQGAEDAVDVFVQGLYGPFLFEYHFQFFL